MEKDIEKIVAQIVQDALIVYAAEERDDAIEATRRLVERIYGVIRAKKAKTPGRVIDRLIDLADDVQRLKMSLAILRYMNKEVPCES